mgnify:CR=1 FL=1
MDDYKVQEAYYGCSDVSELKLIVSNQSVIHVNIRSMYKNFDVIVISETHFIYDRTDFNIPGYSIIFNESKLNRCNGCIMYIKQDIFLGHEILMEEQLKVIKVTLKNIFY